jgi:hypothetical protein
MAATRRVEGEPTCDSAWITTLAVSHENVACHLSTMFGVFRESDISLSRRLFVARIDQRIDDDCSEQNQALDEILQE